MLCMCWVYVDYTSDLYMLIRCWIDVGYVLNLCGLYVEFMSNRCWIDVGYIQSRIEANQWTLELCLSYGDVCRRAFTRRPTVVGLSWPYQRLRYICQKPYIWISLTPTRLPNNWWFQYHKIPIAWQCWGIQYIQFFSHICAFAVAGWHLFWVPNAQW